MFKRAIEIIKLAAAVILISSITIWTTGIIVTHYLDSLLKQYNIPFDTKPVIVSGFWGTLWGANPPVKKETAEDPGDAVEVFGQLPGDITNETDPSHIEDDSESGSNSNISGGTDTEEEANSPITESNESPDLDGVDTAMTMEEISSVKDSISAEDKEQLFAMLVGKLPQESWQTISEIVEGGVTEQELSTIQQLIAMHLDKVEYEQMMDILKKY